MDVIESMYRNLAQPSERNMLKDEEYTKAKNQIKQYYQFLMENISKREAEVLDKLMQCYETKADRKNIRCFEAGIKAGISVSVTSQQ